ERRRFRFPRAFVPLLPRFFQGRQLESKTSGSYREEVARNKLTGIVRESGEVGWRLANGELFFAGKPISAEILLSWRWKQLDAQTVCEAAYAWGCLETIEREGTNWYRLPAQVDSMAASLPEEFLDVQDPQAVRIILERAPFTALEPLSKVSRLEKINGGLWAT